MLSILPRCKSMRIRSTRYIIRRCICYRDCHCLNYVATLKLEVTMAGSRLVLSGASYALYVFTISIIYHIMEEAHQLIHEIIGL